MNEIIIGIKVYDTESKLDAHVTNKTSNSIEVYLRARGIDGINCTQWFIISDFNKRFKNESVV